MLTACSAQTGPQLTPCKISLDCQSWQTWASICSSREFSRHFCNADRWKETRSVALKTLCGEGAGRTIRQKENRALPLQFLWMQIPFLFASHCLSSCVTAGFASDSSHLARWLVSHAVQLTRIPHSPTDPRLSHFHLGNPWEIARVQTKVAVWSQFAQLLLRGCEWKGACTDAALQQADLWVGYLLRHPAPISPSLGFWGFPQ